MAATIKGSIEIDGVTTEFVFHAEYGSWSQWGGTTEELGERVEYLEAMERGLAEDTDYFRQDEQNDTDDEEDEEDEDNDD